MSQFSRRARWLNVLFPASVAPQTIDPGVVSDDVSLVQNYDGGGWDLHGGTNPAAWQHRAQGGVGTAGSVLVVTVPDDQIFRCMTGDAILDGGANPAKVRFHTLTPDQMIVSDTLASAFAATGVHENIPMHVPILGPGTTLFGAWLGGNVLTQLTWQVYGVFAPLGTVFHV